MNSKPLKNRKVHLALGSAILTLVVIGAISYRGTASSSASDQRVWRSHEVLQNLQSLLLAMAGVESSYRGFALNGNESYIESYRAGISNAKHDEAALRNLTLGDGAQQRRITDLERLVDQKVEFAETVIGLRRSQGLEAAAGLSENGLGQRIMEQLQGVTREMQNEELRLLALRSADAERRSGQTRIALILSTLLGLLITTAAGWSALRDDTGSRRAAQALRDGEERYRGLLEAAPDAIVVIDAVGNIVLLNLRAEKQFGYSRDELVGKNVTTIIPEGFAERLVADGLRSTEAALAQQIGTGIELTGQRKDGSNFPIEIMLSPLASAEGTLVTAAIRDISVRKQAEETLRNSEECFRLIAETIDQVFWIADSHFAKVAYISPGYERVWGRTQASLYENARSFLEPVHPKDLERTLLRFEIMKSGKPFDHQYRIVRPDGVILWIWNHGFPVYNAKGEVLRYVGVALDITELKRTEERLHEYEKAVEGLEEMILVVDRDYRYVIANRAYLKYRSITREQLVEHAVPDFLDKQVFEAVVKTKMDECFQGKPVNYELRMKFLDLGERDLSISYFPIESPAGVDRIVCVLKDITEQKRTEETLRESEERFRQIAETIDEVFWSSDPQITKINYINPGYERVWGRSQASLYEDPQSFIEAVHSEDRERVIRELETMKTGQTFEHEYRIVRPDGSIRSIWDRGFPVRNEVGEVVRYVGVAQDITERKRAEAEHVRLMTAIEQAAEAVVVTDGDGEIQYVNPAFSTMTGYGREETLGKNPRILKSGKHDAAFYRSVWATILAGEVWKGEMINRRKDGSLYREHMSITPVQNEQGQMTHIVAMKEDITARKLLEDQFRQAQKMEAMGRLAAGVAHDFNNLLTIIIGYGDVLLDQFVADDPMRAYATAIKGAGEKAARLTRQLLAFSRQQVLAPQVLDLNTLIANLTKLLKRLLGEDIDFVFNPGPGPAKIKADPGLLDQVLMNLAVNSRDAMPRGGKLTIETAHIQVGESYRTTHFPIDVGPYVVLAVTDTGCGMDKDTQARIFEPFFTTKEQGRGTGLGLATAYGIVKQSGGHIWVYSEPGAGTTFKIYLPVVEGVLQGAQEYAVPAGGSETVLLVEDDSDLRELARMVLVSRGGYKVLESISGQEARAFAEQYKGTIHLLLTDVVMPGMSGRELGEGLVTSRPDMKVLYMSGYTDDTVVRHGVLEEGMAYLQKPFTAESLLRKVRDVLDTQPHA